MTVNMYIVAAGTARDAQIQNFLHLAGKLNLNWPYSPALPQRPKFKFYFPAKESKDFLVGFIEK